VVCLTPCRASHQIEDRHEHMNIKRMRGRNHRPNNGGGGGGFSRNQQNGIPLNRNHVFDSSGPEMRVRGTAQQLFDKYTQMARDASSSGDRVLGEAYYQHAEHYFRIISAINQAQGVPNPPQNGQNYAQGGEGENEQQQQQQPRPENRQEQQPRHDNQNRQEYRQDRPERSENRDNNRQDNRDNRNNDGNRQDRPRFEQRPRPEFQQRDRGDRPFRQPQPPIAEAPIDISSALEAELTAAVAEPPGLSEQPQIRHAIQHELLIPSPPAPAPAAAPAPEPRAIPISTKAPPPPPEEPAAPVPTRRPRGRPKLVKAETPSE
jgi:hypothetical protein